MTDQMHESFPSEGAGGVEDHSDIDVNKMIGDEHEAASIQDLHFFAQDQKDTGGKMLDGLANTGTMKRHQGVYPPARYPEHYGTPFK